MNTNSNEYILTFKINTYTLSTSNIQLLTNIFYPNPLFENE